MKENKDLEQAHKKLEDISNDEQMRILAEWRESAEYMYNTGMKENYNKGLSAGIEQRY